MKRIFLPILAAILSAVSAQATLSPSYHRYAIEDGDTEALYAYDDGANLEDPITAAALNRLKTSAISAGAETQAEVNEYVNIAYNEMKRKLNLYISLAN